MTVPIALTVAGSDSGGGAGIQADLKTFAAHGVFGTSALTAVTAQNTRGVRAIHAVPPEVVTAQIDAVFEDLAPAAVKIGMLGSAELIVAVAAALRRWSGPPLVLDPVMVAKSGDRLLDEGAISALREELAPLATLITPNLPEAAALLGEEIAPEMRDEAARRLAGLGPAVLLKGGHAAGDEVVDLLWSAGSGRELRHPRRATTSDHGTGCTLSAAIAARLARGEELAAAVEGAVAYLQEALRLAPGLGAGRGPLAHFPQGTAS